MKIYTYALCVLLLAGCSGLDDQIDKVINKLVPKEEKKEVTNGKAVKPDKLVKKLTPGKLVKTEVSTPPEITLEEDKTVQFGTPVKLLVLEERKVATTKLFDAVDSNDPSQVDEAIQKGADLEAKEQEHGFTPLMRSAYHGHADSLKTLIEAGANVKTKNKAGHTVLMTAAWGGHTDMVKILIEKGADVNAKGKHDDRTALMFAAHKGSMDTVQALIDKGADVDAVDKNGYTALDYAKQEGHTDIEELLVLEERKVATTKLFDAVDSNDPSQVDEAIQKGAELEAKEQEHGFTPLMRAAYHGHADSLKTLIEAGANVNTKNKAGHTVLMTAAWGGHTDMVKILIEKGADVNAKGKHDDRTALMFAAHKGSMDTVQALIDKGADVDAVDKNGYTALDYAKQEGHTDIEELLALEERKVATTKLFDAVDSNDPSQVDEAIQKGADLEAKEKEHGFTPLMRAAYHGHADSLKSLINAKANVNAKSKTGYTALMNAAWRGSTDIVKTLIDNGADVNAKGNDGRTALMFAADNGHMDIVQALIDEGADMTAQDKSGYTALMYAIGKKRTEVAKAIINNGADIEAKDKKGTTALMFAAAHNQLEVAKLLIAKGANVNAKNAAGHTALVNAVWQGYTAIVEALVNANADVTVRHVAGKTVLEFATMMNEMDIVNLLKAAGATE